MTTDYSLSRSPDELFNPWRRAQGNLQNKENTFLLILQHYIFPPSSTIHVVTLVQLCLREVAREEEWPEEGQGRSSGLKQAAKAMRWAR